MPALLQEPTSEFSLHHADSNAPPSPSVVDAVAYALQQCPGFSFLPSNNDSQGAFPHDISSSAASQFSCDDFRIYEFKVRRCMRGRSHDWTECPFAHPGEKARRRDPRRVHYSGTPCPDFRKGSCRRGEACEFAHGVFECWLHPARYRTQVCKDGKNCKRRVCFFAHSPEQLRILPVSMAPTTMPDVSPASSTRGLASSLNIALEDTISSMPRRMSRGHAFICSPPSSLSSTLAHPSNQVNQDTFQHLESASNTTSLRRAVMQNMLACTGYGVNLNSSDFPSVSDCFEDAL